MGQHVPDVDFAPVEMEGRNQAVFVPTNVKHDDVSHFVRRWEGGSQGLETCKVVPLHDFVPPGKGTFAVGVLRPKLP
jgi:hypothetical protein